MRWLSDERFDGGVLLAVLLVVCVVLLQGCAGDDGRAGGGAVTPPAPQLPPLPGVAAKNVNASGWFVPVALSPADIDLAEVGTSGGAICMIVFTGTVNGNGDHEYEYQCSVRPNPALVPAHCEYDAVLDFAVCDRGKHYLEVLLEAVGPTRDLTPEEDALHRAIATATLCTAERRNGSAPPIECNPV